MENIQFYTKKNRYFNKHKRAVKKMNTMLKYPTLISRQQLGIYCYFLVAFVASILIYIIGYFDKVAFEAIVHFISPPTHFGAFLQNPLSFFLHHLLIYNWFEALIGMITIHYLLKNKSEPWIGNFVFLLIVYQFFQSCFSILLLQSFAPETSFRASILPSLIGINLFVNWSSFKDNYIDIPFSKKSIPFYAFWFSIVITWFILGAYNQQIGEILSLTASVIVAFLAGVCFYYFRKKEEPKLNQYLQIQFKQTQQNIPMDASEILIFEANKQKYLDYILDKINRIGIHRLSSREKEFLESFQDEKNEK